MSNFPSEVTNALHAVTHVNRCTCLDGIIANPPGPSVPDLPSFISSLALPLTIMSCSVAVCQCQGTSQPAVPLTRNTEGPFAGSPLCTDDLMHEGRSGIASNLFSDIMRRTPMSCALPMIVQTITNKAS